MSASFALVITGEEAGERLDRVLSARDLGLTRSTLKRWMAEGRVCVDGVAARASDRARAGSSVTVTPAPEAGVEAVPQDIPLDVEYEDDALLVLHKPAGLVVHPAPGHPDGTLANALRFHRALQGRGDPLRPGIVHRLDRDTSGLMVVAKTDFAREALITLFKAHAIEREYVAIVQGRIAEPRCFDTLHGRHPVDRKRFTARVVRGKRAVTHVQPITCFGGATLVACRLLTGRTHQIRVHLSEAGHPVLADPIYGRRARSPDVRAAARAVGRLALHAGVLGFRHPQSGANLRFERPAPPEFAAALRLLQD